MKTNLKNLFAISLAVSALCLSYSAFSQGALTPPGAPAPTMKSLDQIEPRMPISFLPTNITVAGSYYVTTNLTGVSGQNGISINTSDVTIDLNGFTLSGVAGSGSGVYVTDIYTNIVVRNGTLKSWDYRGLDAEASYNSQFLQLRVSDNGDDGIAAGINSVVNQCTAVNNLLDGIYASDGSAIQSCTATDNGGFGIDANAGSMISGCTSVYNAGGISASTGGTISLSSARLNGGDGFEGYQATIVDCTAQANSGRGILAADGSSVSRCTARINSQDGIWVGTGCRITENNCQFNGYNGAGDGIHVFGSENRIEANHVVSNGYGISAIGTNNVVIKNSAQLNGTNYFFFIPQMIGPIVKLTDSVGIITNSNPWANFSN